MNTLTEIMKIQDDKERLLYLKRYEVLSKAKEIAKSRFNQDVKFIYANCNPSSIDNGDYDRLCETLGVSEDKCVALSELIRNKNSLGGIIYDIIDRIRELSERNENIDYDILLLRMFITVASKQDILHLYSCMFALLKLDQIKAIQTQINQ